jgi:hypothetical protein
MSGSASERVVVVTANGRSLPVLIYSINDCLVPVGALAQIVVLASSRFAAAGKPFDPTTIFKCASNVLAADKPNPVPPRQPLAVKRVGRRLNDAPRGPYQLQGSSDGACHVCCECRFHPLVGQ